MSDKPASFRAIIDLWPTRKVFAQDLKVGESAAKLMYFRDNIHSSHWQRLIEAAKTRRLKGITLDLLVSLQGQKKAA